MKEFKNEMLLKHQQSLLERESGIKYLLQHDKVEDLTLLYSLYQDHPEALQPIALAFKDHIFQHGLQLIQRVDLTQDESQPKDHSKIKEILVQT